MVILLVVVVVLPMQHGAKTGECGQSAGRYMAARQNT
jgi:hypothetical protein